MAEQASTADLNSLLSPASVAIAFDTEFAQSHLHSVESGSSEDDLEVQRARHLQEKLSSLEDSLLVDRATALPDAPADKILDAYYEHVTERTSHHFGYPYNLKFRFEELFKFLRFSINNLGDPFDESNYGVHSRQFEIAVLDFFAELWKIPKDDYWGYVTTCGTEGNLEAIYLAREKLPEGVLIASTESHYSVFKAARFYRMQSIGVKTLRTGEIDYDQLSDVIEKHKDGQIILSVNIGTTVKGAVDNLDRVLRILQRHDVPRERYYIHCDGALFALMMPFVTFAPDVSFARPIDSIAVSGHKFLGSPMPCGIMITHKANVKRVETEIEYLNSVDTTITGSRNGQASLLLWYSLRRKGLRGIWIDVQTCMRNAKRLANLITEAGISCMLNDMSTTVVFERPEDDAFIKKWQLACVGRIAHAVVMPSTTDEKIDSFAADLRAVMDGKERQCVEEHLGERFCLCTKCKK